MISKYQIKQSSELQLLRAHITEEGGQGRVGSLSQRHVAEPPRLSLFPGTLRVAAGEDIKHVTAHGPQPGRSEDRNIGHRSVF